MELTVIGYWGGFPAENGASSLYLVRKEETTIALDFGSGALLKLQKYLNVTELDAVLLSHYHADHIADIGVLQHALLVNAYITGVKRKVPIYGHREDEQQFNFLHSDYTKGIGYEPDKKLAIGPFTIQFLKTKHSVPCYGMKITDGTSTIVYTADTAYQDSWIEFTKGADLLLADCNFYANQDGELAGHMTSKEVAYIAKKAEVRHLILSHLPHYGEHKQLVREAEEIYNGQVELAYEGLTWKNKR